MQCNVTCYAPNRDLTAHRVHTPELIINSFEYPASRVSFDLPCLGRSKETLVAGRIIRVHLQ